MKPGRRKIAVGAAGALGAAGLATGAIAATSGSSDDAGDLAAAINKRAGTSITADDVTGAYQDVLKAHLAEAVKAGRITQAQADEMLKRAQTRPGLPPLGVGPGVRGDGHRGPHADVLGAVAEKLGLTEDQVRARLAKGDTLAEIAKAEGVSRADLIAAISAALKAGGVPAARIADLAAHIADDADGPGHGPGGRRGGPGGYGHP